MLKRNLSLVVILSLCTMMAGCTELSDYNQDPMQKITYNYETRQQDEIIDKGAVKGGVLKLFTTTPDTLNPLMTRNVYVQDFLRLVYEGLVAVDENQKPVPVLSDSWYPSQDGLTWTFHIRDGVLWQDGSALTAYDVEYTLKSIMALGVDNLYRISLDNISHFAAVDRSTFRLVLNHADSFTPELMTFPIVSRTFFKEGNMLGSGSLMKTLGTGPYCLQTYDTVSKTIRLIRNDNWWNSASDGKDTLDTPYIYQIDVKVYTNASSAVTAFQTKAVDVISLDRNQSSRYTGRQDLMIKKFSGSHFEFMAFNLFKPSPYTDLPVRQAIALAIDREKLVENLLPGEAQAADFPLLPDSCFQSDLPLKRNLEKARKLLQDAGWKEKDGARYKKVNGVLKPLKLQLLVNNDNDTRLAAAEILRNQLQEVGIILDVVKAGWDEIFKLVGDKKFDMLLLGLKLPTVPDPSFLYSSSSIINGSLTDSTAYNLAGYSSPMVDQYLQSIRSTYDYERKKAFFLNMQAQVQEDAPYIGLFFYSRAVLVSKRIRGEITPYIGNIYHDITHWYIPIQ